jgi:hypothetical protein
MAKEGAPDPKNLRVRAEIVLTDFVTSCFPLFAFLCPLRALFATPLRISRRSPRFSLGFLAAFTVSPLSVNRHRYRHRSCLISSLLRLFCFARPAPPRSARLCNPSAPTPFFFSARTTPARTPSTVCLAPSARSARSIRPWRLPCGNPSAARILLGPDKLARIRE